MFGGYFKRFWLAINAAIDSWRIFPLKVSLTGESFLPG